jgi:Tfp pilus assembly protein PilF
MWPAKFQFQNRAVMDHTKAIRLEPNNADFYASRAEVYRAKGQEQEAAADERKASELRN